MDAIARLKDHTTESSDVDTVAIADYVKHVIGFSASDNDDVHITDFNVSDVVIGRGKKTLQ